MTKARSQWLLRGIALVCALGVLLLVLRRAKTERGDVASTSGSTASMPEPGGVLDAPSMPPIDARTADAPADEER
ncbi:MAG: hypothetical protein ACKO4Q_08180, partial [Planctomycetota bacterium]